LINLFSSGERRDVGGFSFHQTHIFRREERGSEPLGEHHQRGHLRKLKMQQDYGFSFAFQPETKPCTGPESLEVDHFVSPGL
jgi:hypothetical protein